jgi:pimeloyl-ACP methyl ester carboxylesterase
MRGARSTYSIAAILFPALAAAAPLAGFAARAAQAPAEPTPGRAAFSIFVRGAQIGREEVDLSRGPGGWTISSSGRISPPIDITTSRFEIRYGADWHPVELKIEASMRGSAMGLATSFATTSAINEITQDGRTNSKTDQITARTVVLPNNFFAAYEALAARLSAAKTGDELRAYIAPQGEIPVRINDIVAETIRTPDRAVAVRRFRLTFVNPGGPLDADVWVDDRSRMARLEIPSVSVQVVREELATVAARVETTSHPGDEAVFMPAPGFTLAGTLTRPAGPSAAQRLKLPAVILIGGSGSTDRDQTIAGIPIFVQLAGALADAGFIAVRYDKRGVGQSGGRLESATLGDFAEDARAVVKYLSKRKDVDRRRIALIGHGDGGSVALIAASREKSIAAVVPIAAPGTTGAELILEQQRHVLDRLKAPEPDKQAKIELQKTIHQAVLTGSGWEGVPPELRKQADTPWFHSLLTFDPAKVVPKVRQPMLVIQGALDTQVPASHAARLGELANARKNRPKTEVVVIDGVNHLLVPATTGEVDEYAQLKEKTISPAVVEKLVGWLRGAM